MTIFNPAIHYPIYASIVATSNATRNIDGSYNILHPILFGIFIGMPMLLIFLFFALTIISLVFDLGKEDLFLGLGLLCLALMLFGFIICSIAEVISYIF